MIHGDDPQARLLTAVRADDVAGAERAEGAAVNQETDGLTPVMVAAGLGHEAVVSLLLKYGADVNVLDDAMGMSTLHVAAEGGSIAVAALLLQRRAALNLQAPSRGSARSS